MRHVGSMVVGAHQGQPACFCVNADGPCKMNHASNRECCVHARSQSAVLHVVHCLRSPWNRKSSAQCKDAAVAHVSCNPSLLWGMCLLQVTVTVACILHCGLPSVPVCSHHENTRHSELLPYTPKPPKPEGPHTH